MSLLSLMDTAAVKLRTITAFRVVYAQPPDSLGELPCAVVFHNGSDYDYASGGQNTGHRLVVKGFWSLGAGHPAAYRACLPFIDDSGASSVKIALETEPTLGGNDNDLRVERVSNPRGEEYGSTAYLTVVWEVRTI